MSQGINSKQSPLTLDIKPMIQLRRQFKNIGDNYVTLGQNNDFKAGTTSWGQRVCAYFSALFGSGSESNKNTVSRLISTIRNDCNFGEKYAKLAKNRLARYMDGKKVLSGSTVKHVLDALTKSRLHELKVAKREFQKLTFATLDLISDAMDEDLDNETTHSLLKSYDILNRPDENPFAPLNHFFIQTTYNAANKVAENNVHKKMYKTFKIPSQDGIITKRQDCFKCQIEKRFIEERLPQRLDEAMKQLHVPVDLYTGKRATLLKSIADQYKTESKQYSDSMGSMSFKKWTDAQIENTAKTLHVQHLKSIFASIATQRHVELRIKDLDKFDAAILKQLQATHNNGEPVHEEEYEEICIDLAGQYFDTLKLADAPRPGTLSSQEAEAWKPANTSRSMLREVLLERPQILSAIAMEGALRNLPQSCTVMKDLPFIADHRTMQTSIATLVDTFAATRKALALNGATEEDISRGESLALLTAAHQFSSDATTGAYLQEKQLAPTFPADRHGRNYSTTLLDMHDVTMPFQNILRQNQLLVQNSAVSDRPEDTARQKLTIDLMLKIRDVVGEEFTFCDPVMSQQADIYKKISVPLASIHENGYQSLAAQRLLPEIGNVNVIYKNEEPLFFPPDTMKTIADQITKDLQKEVDKTRDFASSGPLSTKQWDEFERDLHRDGLIVNGRRFFGRGTNDPEGQAELVQEFLSSSPGADERTMRQVAAVTYQNLPGILYLIFAQHLDGIFRLHDAVANTGNHTEVRSVRPDHFHITTECQTRVIEAEAADDPAFADHTAYIPKDLRPRRRAYQVEFDLHTGDTPKIDSVKVDYLQIHDKIC